MVTRPSWKNLSRLCISASHKSNRMTSFGINNQGYLIFDYYHEDVGNNSVLGQTNVYNGYNSVLWVNFEQAFSSEIQTTYSSWRSGNNPLLSYDKVVENFITNHSDKWSISIYNEDAEYKYISGYRNNNDAANLYQVRGTGEEHLKYFIKNRLMYCDSKWKTGDFIDKDNNTIKLRINAPNITGELAPSSTIKYTTFSNMYAGVGSGAKEGVSDSQYTDRGNEVSFTLTVTNGQNNLDVYIFGASEISEIADMSLLYCDLINVSAASKLTKLIIGNNNSNYQNNNLTSLSLSNNRLLREINICNCTGLTNIIDFSLCPDIQYIYATGSCIAGVQLPNSGFLKKISLPSTIASLNITNQHKIQSFECEGYSNITTLKIENSTMVIEQEDGTTVSTDRFPLQEILLGCDIANLVSVSIKDIKWDVESEDVLNTIINKLLQKSGFILEGTVYLPDGVTVSDGLKTTIHQNFPNLSVIDDSPVFYIDYYNFDNTIWDTEIVAAGNNAVGPSKGQPDNIIQDEQGLRHLFVEWNTLPTNVNKNCQVDATWQTQYAISFCDEDGTTQYIRLWSDVNEPPIDPVEYGVFEGELTENKIYEPTKESDDPENLQYKFNGWSGLPDKVTGTTSVYATFIEQYPVRFYETTRQDAKQKQYGDTQWVIEGGNATKPVPDPTKTSDAQYHYTFSGWDGDYTDIEVATSIYATYSTELRRYSVHFYNGDTLLQTREDIPYGGSTTYTKETPVKTGVDNPEEYEFKGWIPSPNNITGETKCYALFKFTGHIKDDWVTIAENVTNGTAADVYEIGGRKEIPLTFSDGTTITADVEIIAFNHDNLADGSGKATLTFFCKDLPQLKWQFNISSTNSGGYEVSNIRERLNSELFNALPEELRNIIKPVYKISDGGSSNPILITTTDSCWLASYDEVGLPNGANNLPGQGELYASIFSDNSSRAKTITDNTATGGWWLRSSNINADTVFRVTNGGGSYGDIATGNYYVAFGFCI